MIVYIAAVVVYALDLAIFGRPATTDEPEFYRRAVRGDYS